MDVESDDNDLDEDENSFKRKFEQIFKNLERIQQMNVEMVEKID